MRELTLMYEEQLKLQKKSMERVGKIEKVRPKIYCLTNLVLLPFIKIAANLRA